MMISFRPISISFEIDIITKIMSLLPVFIILVYTCKIVNKLQLMVTSDKSKPIKYTMVGIWTINTSKSFKNEICLVV